MNEAGGVPGTARPFGFRRHLRVSQAVHLKLSDLDSRRMVLCVRHGKGGQEQYGLLPERL